MNDSNREIEVKFLEVDQDKIRSDLKKLGAEDLGEDFLAEIIFYDKNLEWLENRNTVFQLARLRKNRAGIFLTYKYRVVGQKIGVKEIEFKVDDMEKARSFLEELGLVAYRFQEKKRHSFKLGEVTLDLDTWPKAPTYLEIEGPDEASLKLTAEKLDLDWARRRTESAGYVLEKDYNIPAGHLRYFTFDRIA